MPFHLTDLVADTPLHFRTQAAVREPIREACQRHADIASFHELGTSEEGRPIMGVVMGTGGSRVVSLIAGNHADEPVGPETLRTFILEGLRRRDELADLLNTFRFVIVPHTNPDGEARNQPWIKHWPDLGAFLRHVVRELPGRDMEFGFPAMRQETRIVAGFLRDHAPLAMHASLHGMAFSEGAMLLIERHWCGERTARLREQFTTAAQEAGLHLHDHNRKGEKGFFYVEPGFTTTPEGAAMRAHFLALGDEVTAARFHDSSMEYVRSLGGDPLCLVTEMPLFVVDRHLEGSPGEPATYLALTERLPEIKARVAHGVAAEQALDTFQMHPLPLRTAMHLQLRVLQIGLEAIPEALP